MAAIFDSGKSITLDEVATKLKTQMETTSDDVKTAIDTFWYKPRQPSTSGLITT